MLRHGESEFSSVKNVTIIKMVLAIAMYPNLAVGDTGNTYNARDDKQFFHTVKKNFVSIHPNSVYNDVLRNFVHHLALALSNWTVNLRKVCVNY